MKCHLLSIAILWAAGLARAQTATPVANINAAKSGPPISPYVYGQFLEHAGDIIYRGLWSEMLDDRKFYFPVMPKPPEETNAPARGAGGFSGRRRGISAG